MRTKSKFTNKLFWVEGTIASVFIAERQSDCVHVTIELNTTAKTLYLQQTLTFNQVFTYVMNDFPLSYQQDCIPIELVEAALLNKQYIRYSTFQKQNAASLYKKYIAGFTIL